MVINCCFIVINQFNINMRPTRHENIDFSSLCRKIENFDFLKNLQKNVKWILSHSIGIMTKYNWWIPMRIKIMTITLLLKILEKKIEFLEIGPFRKMAKTFFSIKDIN